MKFKNTKPSVLFLALMALSIQGLFAQQGITNIYTETTSSASGSSYSASGATGSPLAGNTYSYKYGSNSTFNDNNISLLSLQTGNTGYRYESIPVEVYFRRVNNSNVSGVRDLMFYFGTLAGTALDLKAPYVDEMATAFTGNTNLLRGSDNLFANTGDGNGNNNNIERLDVVVSAGILLTSASGQGFAVMERGALNQHDAFVAGVITGIDGSGNPTAYSNLVRVTSANYGSVNIVPNQNSAVLRRDNNTGELKVSTTLSGQGIGGVFFKFSDFGLTDGQTVYGYSLTANDFPVSGTPANFVDYTNSTFFPTNTNSASAGGIDMIALTGLVKIISISGNVYNDINGLTDNLVNGNPLNEASGTALYANLINSSGNVIQSAMVNPDGTFTFEGVPLGELKVELSTIQGTTGNPAPARTLPSNWVYAGELAGDGATAANNQGQAIINITANNIENINFGIQQKPLAGTSTLPEQTNPGGTNFVSVPATSFSGSDFDGGNVVSIKIVSFPIGVNTLDINGTTYTSATFPVDGITIPANANGEPTQSVLIDPVDGDVSVTIVYVTIDNAGFESELPGQVVMPFTQAIIIIENFFPALGFGTLAFEDLWPGKGDYDFNDLVIDYQFEITTNALNFVEQVKGTFIIKAFGASFENGFGFQLSSAINPADLTVTGYELTENIINLESNGVEAGQTKPTIIVYDNAFAQMPHPGIGIGVNTEPSAPYVQPVTLTVNIGFKPSTYTYNDLDISNFNPFLIVNKNRSHEVHLPNYPPTDLIDMNLFGQWEDASDPATGKYYVTVNNLPWAINIYERFDYPIEKQEILWVHLKFAEWAISGGVQFPDWYKNLTGYRNNSLIYQVPAK
ncbi:MAG: LruC domain-containing protein [Bacteroidales bacterium]|nr:LruC domain-containing protein [Bacteroidales bacterium]